jgi:AcrR family transcriptional regulator
MPETVILTPKQRRQRNRDEMTAAIVQVARDMMQREGVAALNLTGIARRLEIQTPSLYEYFPNKLALYDYLYLLGMRQFRQQMNAVFALPAADPWDKIEQLITAHLRFAVENPDLFKLVFERHVPGFEPSETSMAEAYATLAEADAAMLPLLSEVGLASGEQVMPMREFFIAILHGISSQHLANEPHLAVGEGRFGSLVPFVVQMLKNASSSKPNEVQP